jgi:hypothetical protein
MLSVEALEDRVVPSTTSIVQPPSLQFRDVPASAQAGAKILVGVVESGGTTNNALVSSQASITANLFLASNGATLSLGSVSVLDGIGFTTVQLPSYPETAILEAVAGSLRVTTNLNITPGTLTHFVVSAPSQATAGTPFQVTVTAEDALGNTVTSDNQTPTLTASSAAPVTVSGFQWANGIGRATVTQNKAGSMTLTAAAGSIKNSTSVSVISAVATHFQVTLDGGATELTSGVSSFVDLVALDANGKVVTNFNQTPTITASYGSPVTLGGIFWSNGKGFASVIAAAPGTTTLTFTAGKVTGTSKIITVVPSDSSDWSGYTIRTATSSVTAVGATWVQPADFGPNNADGLIWVGIDGANNGTVEQCGTKMTMVNGKAEYSAFYELFGDQTPSSQSPNPNPTGPDFFETFIPATTFRVQPGDTISAAVFLVPTTTNSFMFEMTDKPANGGPLETFSLVQTPQFITAQRSSAEWIVENDNVPNQPLANYGQVTFTGAWAATGPTLSHPGSVGSVSSFLSAQAVEMTVVAKNPPVGVNPVHAVSIPSATTTSNTLGFLEPAAGVFSSSFTVSWFPANGVLPPVSTALNAAIGHSSVLGSTAAVDVLFAHDAQHKPVRSTAAANAAVATAARNISASNVSVPVLDALMTRLSHTTKVADVLDDLLGDLLAE